MLHRVGDGWYPGADPFSTHTEVPWVKVDASPQRFGRGQELQLNCTAGGHPQPQTFWKRWGWALEEDER